MADIDSTMSSLVPQLGRLSTLLEENLELFASGSKDLQLAALNAAKYVFDISVQSENTSRSPINELLSSLTPAEAPQTRSKAKADATERSSNTILTKSFQSTPLASLFVDGMDEEQIWAQLDLRTKSICEMLDLALEGELDEGDVAADEDESSEEEDEDKERDDRLRKALEALERGEDVDLDALRDDLGGDEDSLIGDEDFEMDDEEDTEEDENSTFSGDEDLEEGITNLRDDSSDEPNEEETLSFTKRAIQRTTRRKGSKGKSQLDDGFFDLDSFNAETEQAEAKSTSKGHLADEDDSDDDISVDLFAPVDDLDDVEEDNDHNSGEPFYSDFFEAPRRPISTTKFKSGSKPEKAGKVRFHEEVRVKKIRPKGKNLPLSVMEVEDREEEEEEDDDDDFVGDLEDLDEEQSLSDQMDSSGDRSDSDEEMVGFSDDELHGPTGRETIERLKGDLFADDDEGPAEDLTTHEQRMAALREQITELESQNVAKKEWMLMGEAGSRERPQNALLEENLEFERVMKAVPVITEESVQVLEERIKTRILEGRFDDVVRIRPLEDKPFLPSRFFELQDSKSSQSLAQIYENDYVASQSGGPVDDRDGKLKKEHEEIEQLWEKICGKLDALCNAHFVPKQPKAIISTLSNVSTATLESALPTAKSVSTMLAPEEILAPSSSEPRARSELTPAEKRALRTKGRKAKKKQRDTLDKSLDKFAKGIGGVKKQKQAALEQVVKHGKGVTVVGKKGKDLLAKKDRKSRT
ncbi:U3 small nucleolar ribonucleo protein complex, subunit Mpp10 [Crucibulum laeve]|uniref:U3 small nucleolar ribonucleoprotein protein MPP10 n=1 Tax=Crucibulum laeve TaxID=68775 RepID=A0A5C3M8V0_9AGAR|nr:U3 small nucleolar ribonucleo protein complex, subunit Mpp10 [Crucibulum laeve]